MSTTVSNSTGDQPSVVDALLARVDKALYPAGKPAGASDSFDITSTKGQTQFNLGSGTIDSLFDVCIDNAQIDELLKQYPPERMHLIISLMMAKVEGESIENTVNSINMGRMRQVAQTNEIINATKYAQEQTEKLAYEEDDWKKKAGTSPSGGPTVDPPEENDKWWEILIKVIVLIVIVVATVVACAVAGPMGGLLVLGLVMLVVGIMELVKVCSKNRKVDGAIDKALSFISPAQIAADLVMDVVCAANGTDINDPAMKKIKMWVKLGADIIMILIMVAMTVASLGAASGAVISSVLKIIEIASMVAQVATGVASGVQGIVQGKKDLDLAEKRLAIDKISAIISKLRQDADLIGQQLDLLMDAFGSDLNDIKKAYEAASRNLKAEHETKMNIVRNF
ncbi:MAG: hypothetical protein LBR91_01920 [Puniceicoccales bacterium]|jgi:hypothetical protein|nr:hypothetical protein [Puniceicoccales bacterium]